MSAKLLREKAEQKLAVSLIDDGNESKSRRQLHELQVHQVELEMQKIELELQNEALIAADVQMNIALQSYTDLYDFAPIAYLTIAPNGNIRHANLAASTLLGKSRHVLSKVRLGIFVSETELPMFNAFLEKAFVSRKQQSFETQLLVDGNTLPVVLHTCLHQQGTDLLLEIVNATEVTQAIQHTQTIKSTQVALQAQKSAMDEHSLVSITDIKGTITYANSKFCAVSGYSQEELIGSNHRLLNSKYQTKDYWREMFLVVSKGGVWNDEILNLAKDGTKYWVNTTIVPLYEDGQISGYTSIRTDITEQKENVIRLVKAKLQAEQHTQMIKSTQVALQAQKSAMDEHSLVSITDIKGTITYANSKFCAVSGYSQEELIGSNHRLLNSKHQTKDYWREMFLVVSKGDVWNDEILNLAKDGTEYWVNTTIVPLYEDEQLSGYTSIRTDITQQKELQKKELQTKLERMAQYDDLTSLPNRVLLADRLSQAIMQCNHQQQSLAVAFIDLDGFKVVNDRYGNNVGDELLIAISQRMKEVLGENDTLARFGGDEFVAVLSDLAKVEDCRPVLERFLLAASKPFNIGDLVIKISASIGVTLYPQDSVDRDILLRHSDQAMYVAKESGKNRYHMFDIASNDVIKTQRKSLDNIRSAFDRQEFVLYYQPKVNMSRGDVVGVEALIRWQHPVQGLIPPLDFLPAIEGYAISLDIGEWVIDTALSQISQWQREGLLLPISVNISAYQIQQADFVERLAMLLAAYPDVLPVCLGLEILETSALSDIKQVAATMEECIALGVRFSLDDFGTGYSSLTYLKRLPASLIKIDQSFVRDMLDDADDLAIVESVVALAKSFKRDVIAEGVETVEHGTALLQLGCELAQGYGIAKPMPKANIPAWVNEWKPDDAWRS